jgi:hypothetical protein
VNRAEVSDQAVRLRTLIQGMRWSGMAIRDTVTLRRDRLSADNLLTLRRAVSCPAIFVSNTDRHYSRSR